MSHEYTDASGWPLTASQALRALNAPRGRPIYENGVFAGYSTGRRPKSPPMPTSERLDKMISDLVERQRQ